MGSGSPHGPCRASARRAIFLTWPEPATTVAGHMEQEIRFCELDGRRVAYATVGGGLSDRGLTGPPTLDSEARALASVIRACGNEPAVLFACSCAGLATALFCRNEPER